MIDAKQRTLFDFFAIIDKASWQLDLQNIIKDIKMDVWDIDVNALASEYQKICEQKKDLNRYVTGILICSILLKYKSRHLGLKELESYIEEELKDQAAEIEQKIEHIEPDIDDPTQLTLEEFAKRLGKAFSEQKTEKKSLRVKKEIYIPISKEDFKTTGQKLLEYIKKEPNKTYSYWKLRSELELNNNLFMTLMYLHNDDKLVVEQNKQYDDFTIRLAL